MKTKFLDSNPIFKEYYEKLTGIFDYADKYGICIDSLCGKIFNVYPYMLHGAQTEEQAAFVSACAREIVGCYQRALERNYDKIRDCKERGVMDSCAIEYWTLTLDKEGNPAVTAVVDIDKKGYPIYADNCTSVIISDEVRTVGNYRYKLNRWLESNGNLYELKAAAEELKKKGKLGLSDKPVPNYGLEGLVGGQLDAAAWQNYAIENGMVRRTDYDDALDKLLIAIDECIDFYEKALSIV